MASDGGIGRGIQRDRERERIKGTVKGRSRERHQKAGLGTEGGSPQKPQGQTAWDRRETQQSQ